MLAVLSLAGSQYRLNLLVLGASYQDPNWEPHNCTQSSHTLLPAPNQGLNPQVSSFPKVLPHVFYLVLHALWYPTFHPWQSWGAGQQSRHSTCKIRYGQLTTLWTSSSSFLNLVTVISWYYTAVQTKDLCLARKAVAHGEYLHWSYLSPSVDTSVMTIAGWAAAGWSTTMYGAQFCKGQHPHAPDFSWLFSR